MIDLNRVLNITIWLNDPASHCAVKGTEAINVVQLQTEFSGQHPKQQNLGSGEDLDFMDYCHWPDLDKGEEEFNHRSYAQFDDKFIEKSKLSCNSTFQFMLELVIDWLQIEEFDKINENIL
jgi:hypothetical protein